jgi:hypothetical protein
MLGRFLRFIYTREIPANPRVWHRRNLFWPVRCLDGSLRFNVWRRQTRSGKWEYQTRPETLEEWWDRQG